MGNSSEARRYPPVEKKIDDYEATGRAHGHDGHPPQFVTRKEHPWVNGSREPTDSHFNVNHSRVCFLFTNKRIEERQFVAAERLCKDWEKSQVEVRASSVLVGNGCSGGVASGPLDDKIAAGGRYEAAMKAIGRGADIVGLVVITNMTVEMASANLRFNRQRGWGRFDLALHNLADHYRL